MSMTQSRPDSNPGGLFRGLGLAQATALNVNNMIGIGPFLILPLMVTDMGGPQALLAWFMFAYRSENVQRTFAVPIEYRNLPEGWVLEGVTTPEAMVTLTGSQREFNLLNPSRLVISLNLSGVEEGTQRFSISEDELRHPSNLKVYRIEPNLILVEVHKTSMLDLPVQVRTQGQLPAGLRLVGLKVLPSSVQARVPDDQRQGLGHVETEPVDLSAITRTTLVRVDLSLPESLHLIQPELPEVQVTVEVAEGEKAR